MPEPALMPVNASHARRRILSPDGRDPSAMRE
jgi:hypothetical protein